MITEYTIARSTTNSQIPLIANIPHSSTFIPQKVRESFVLTDAELNDELLRMTDCYTDELFSAVTDVGGISFVHNTSRLVLDPERFEDDEKEEMAKKGMGVIYTKISNGKPLRYNCTELERKNLLDTYYRPYHQGLEQEVQNLLNRFNKCMIIDCHSFPSKPLPYENPNLKRPDICIGTSEFHTPNSLEKTIKEFCEQIGWSAALNEPFSGTYVPMKFYEKDKQVSSVMIEINRKLYMNEKTGKKLKSYNIVKNNVTDIIASIADQKIGRENDL